MLRPSVSRRFLGLAIAATAVTGAGAAGAAGAWAAWGADNPPAPAALTAAASTTAAPRTDAAPAPAAAPLTVDQAKAIALHTSPGTVVDVQQDNQAADPTEANDPTEAKDPTEPTGPEYEVTVLHSDGSATEVTVDATTGRVVTTKQKDDWNGN